VDPFIYGDRVPVSLGNNAGGMMRSTYAGRVLGDVARLSLGVKNARAAWSLIGPVHWAYERFASFQALGRKFQSHGIPWILETNGPFYEEAYKERRTLALASVAEAIEMKAYRDCDVLVCVSNPLREILSTKGVDPEKIVVLPNGVDTERFDPKKHSPRRIFPGLTIGFIGRLNEWQAIPRLLRALHQLKKDNLELSLVIVGDGVKRTEWSSLARELGLIDRVHFTGQVSGDDVPSLIAGCDLGFSGQIAMKNGSMYHSPLKIYEYMAMGKPVLASSHDDARSAIRPGSSGFLFDTDEELLIELRSACENQKQLPAMGALARREILRAHSWKARVQTLIEKAEQVLHSHATSSKSGNPRYCAEPHHAGRVVA
jgi:glycosyltransferase involved in cell wall biosynthesis